MARLTTFLAFAVSLLLQACSPAAVLNGLASSNGMRVNRDITYAPGKRQSLDIYAPENASGAPVLLFFYGGRWSSGSKADYRFLATAFAAKGIVTIVPDYRLYPDVKFSGFLEDGAAASRWVHDHVANYGGNPKRVMVMGHSAGAYIAAMLMLDRQWLAKQSLTPRQAFRAGIGISGPYDFLPLKDEDLKDMFGPEESIARTQPINFADGKAPPLLLLTGGEDKTVSPRNSKKLAARITEQGGQAKLILYPKLGHTDIVGAFAPSLRFYAPVFRDTLTFIQAETR